MAAKPLTMAVALAVLLLMGAGASLPVAAQQGQAGVPIRPLPRPSAVPPEVTPAILSSPFPSSTEVDVTAGQMVLAPPLVQAPDAGDGPPAAAPASPLAPVASLRPTPRDTWLVPTMRWDDHPRGDRWTAAVLAALRGPGAPLLDVVPRDISAWCPGYATADRGQRAAFWAGLVSTLAWHESTHDPRAVGGGGRWFGLVQIAPGTAQWRNCDVQSADGLLNGAANLRCGIRIMGVTVPRDRVVAEGMRGVAADWGPFHSRRKREDMRRWVRAQEYCQSPTRPRMRPADLVPAAASDALRAVSVPMDMSRHRPVARPVREARAG